MLDWEPLEDGFRLLATFRQGEQMVTLEQWTRWHDEHAYILSMSVDSLDYGELAPLGDAVAESLRFG